ncbi:vacuolar import and degradation protein-domain-containing protein, partial [Phaeosphaeriaceae sp. PMI808]
MPPANSADSEPATISFITALGDLDSPVNQEVLHLAATLGSIQPERGGEGEGEEERHTPFTDARLRRVMSRLSTNIRSRTTTAYGDRVPSANNLYDWSPANELDSDRNRIRSISGRLMSERSGSAGESQSQSHSHSQSQPQSLRSTAILQSVRRHPRFSARSREYLHLSESQARYMSESARQMALHRLSDPRTTLEPRPCPNPTATIISPRLEHTIQYLWRIRHATSIDDSLQYALNAGFLSKDYYSLQYSDFLISTASIPPPPQTSWLSPGAILSGCQHATTTTSPHHLDRWPVKVTIHLVDWTAMTLAATMQAYNVPSHPHTTTTSISPTTNARTSSITTYLEGEILDFTIHTFLTENFKSTTSNDAMYWRKLPPFKSLTDTELVKALTSKTYLKELSAQYVFMRWKERCFVAAATQSHNTEQQQQQQQQQYEDGSGSGSGLTISGFYYACLARADGGVMGLYFDPMSSPYQCLELESRVGGAVGAWGF